MFRNILYYIPVRANRLYRAQDGSKEKKKLLAEIANELPTTGVAATEAIGKRVRRLTSVVLAMAVLGLVSAGAMELFDKLNIGGDTLFAVLFLLTMVEGISSVLLALRIVKLRRKGVLMLLETYRPVCEHFGEDLLREIGVVCAETIDNAENINIVADELESGGMPESLAEGVCVMCGEKLNITEITDFDDNNSALCPHCKKSSVVLKSQYMSEKLLKDMLEYCRAVSETEKLSD